MMLRRMKIWFSIVCMILLFPMAGSSQKKTVKQSDKKILNIPMTVEHWEVHEGKAEFGNYKNVQSVKLTDRGIILKNVDFSNGTIEFDVEPLDAAAKPFVSCYFRLEKYSEAEVFYLRVGREQSDKLNDAVQYSPMVKGVNLWDLLPQYQGPAVIHNTSWNHIKLIVSGKQMRAYVNDMKTPALEIPYLEGNRTNGFIGFEGFAAFANLVIKPDVVEDLPATKGVDLTNHDANYIRKWSVTTPAALESAHELRKDDFPKEGTSWDSLNAERNGLMNLTRKYGMEKRRYVWMKANIKSTADVQRKLQLGFSDEVWVYVNRRLVYVDKNLYLEGMRKNPAGRCSIENSSLLLPLKSGDNELLVGVSNDFYGWGIIARLDNIDGLEFSR